MQTLRWLLGQGHERMSGACISICNAELRVQAQDAEPGAVEELSDSLWAAACSGLPSWHAPASTGVRDSHAASSGGRIETRTRRAAERPDRACLSRLKRLRLPSDSEGLLPGAACLFTASLKQAALLSASAHLSAGGTGSIQLVSICTFEPTIWAS